MRLFAVSACRTLSIALAIALATTAASAETPPGLAPPIAAGIDEVAAKVLEETGVPSASIAVLKDGAIAYTKAYGTARLAPPTPATPAMRYAIGSISKQFTAAALALLAADGKLSLDDPVARFFPDLTRASSITVRQLLSHTAGIRDYWPQDYVPRAMLEPIARQDLMNAWARQPLDFEPGTKRQYSNTGFVVAGAIAEKASGKPLMELLRERIFTPLGMKSVVDVDQGPLPPEDPAGYTRFALGPPRPAPKEGRGWLFAAGELAMTAEDLARWDVSLLDSALLGAPAYRELTTEVLLRDGLGINYGLGLSVALQGDRRVLSHGGEVSGFTAMNQVYPEDRAAIVVLTNQDAAGAAASIAKRIADLLFVSASPADETQRTRVQDVLVSLRKGTIDRSLLTPNANAYFTAAALEDFKTSLGRLGSLTEVTQKQQGVRGGLTTRVYHVVYARKTLEVVTRATPDGRFEQYTVSVE